MSAPCRRGLTALLVAGALGALTLPAPAQVNVFRSPTGSITSLPTTATQGVAGPTVYPQPNYFNYNPYGYGGYYPWGGYMSPSYGYLSGAANVFNAQGQFLMQREQSNLTKEQVKQAEQDTRRKVFDEMAYERANTPSLQDLREKEYYEQARRARGNPPVTEIWSGQSLNYILDGIQKAEYASGMRGPMVPLDDEVVKRVNVSTGTTLGSTGLLKDGGKLSWPLALKSAKFKTEREQIDQLLPEAVGQARAGNVKAETLEQLNDAVRSLKGRLGDAVEDLTPSQYSQTNRYLNQLANDIKVLEEPNVANYFNGAWTVKGNSVGELVDQMTKNGLKFAPATDGNEAYYNALYNALVRYDVALSRMAPRPPQGQPQP